MLVFENGSTLVMAGDSVTDCGRAKPFAVNRKEELGKGYVALTDALLTACYPKLRMRIINAGIGGETVLDLAKRWESDVMDHQPDYVSCMIGINDIGREFDEEHLPHRRTGFERFISTYEEIIARTVKDVKTMYVLSCCYLEPNRDEPLRATVDQYNAAVKELCDKYGAVYIDMMAMFDRGMEDNHPVRYSWDRVHPNLGGHMMLAREFLKAAGAQMG